MRTAYLWAYRVPQLKMPAVELAANPHLALASKAKVALKAAADLSRAREWHLTPAAGGAAIPVEVHVDGAALELDLSKSKAPAGDYRLSTAWDWDALNVA